MHPQQKAAWFVLIVFAVTVVLYLVTVPAMSLFLGKPWTSMATPAMGIFGLCGLWGFARFFYSPSKNREPVMDERDQLLAARAWRTGMATFWLVFVFGCVGSWGFMRYVRGLDRISVPVELFPGMTLAGFIIATITQAIAVLHYYGWRGRNASGQ